jgi:hypothetical protein
MNASLTRGGLLAAACIAAAWAAVSAPASRGDEIQLKDGKSFNGTIVGYDNNMFKVKTDFGFILIEKSKIAAIIPTGSEGPKAGTKPAAGKPSQPTMEPAKADGADAQPTAEPAVESAPERFAARVSSGPVRPQLPSGRKAASVTPAPALKEASSAATSALLTPATSLGSAAGPPTPQIPEEIQGTTYTNHIYGFRMFKAPGWDLIEDPSGLPNAIVAMGTSNESTLMVVGHEKIKQPLDTAAGTVEGRLHDVYEGYRQVSRRKTTVGGLQAIEFRYQGKAEEHDWSGTLVVIARGNDIFTALGMTYADSDLIQIQENVIAKAIASLDFNVR